MESKIFNTALCRLCETRCTNKRCREAQIADDILKNIFEDFDKNYIYLECDDDIRYLAYERICSVCDNDCKGQNAFCKTWSKLDSVFNYISKNNSLDILLEEHE